MVGIFLLMSAFFFNTVVLASIKQQVVRSPIDVVIPCHSKDFRTLELVIDGIKKHGKDIRRIIVISNIPLTNNAEFFDEKRYPFTFLDIARAIFHGNEQQARAYINTPNNRLGWVYQQLLKFYAHRVIPDISDNILMLDADTIFLQNVSFIDDAGYALYNSGSEFYAPYFEHAKRLLPSFKKVFLEHSGVCHHMLMQRSVIEDLFTEILKHHAQEPWQALCHCVDLQNLSNSCLSEYEIYFNFVFSHAYKVKLRHLKWRNCRFESSRIKKCKKRKYDYISCHAQPKAKKK